MKKIFLIFKEINWVDLIYGILAFFMFYIIFAIVMVLTGIWGIFSNELFIFFSGGLIISFVINLIKQIT